MKHNHTPIHNDILSLSKRISRLREQISDYEALLDDIDSLVICSSEKEGIITLVVQDTKEEVKVTLSTTKEEKPIMVDIGAGVMPHLEGHEAVQVVWDLLYNLRFLLTSLEGEKAKIETFAKDNFISYDL